MSSDLKERKKSDRERETETERGREREREGREAPGGQGLAQGHLTPGAGARAVPQSRSPDRGVCFLPTFALHLIWAPRTVSESLQSCLLHRWFPSGSCQGSLLFSPPLPPPAPGL